MIFKQVDAIKQGKKTQTRRLKRPGESTKIEYFRKDGFFAGVVDAKDRTRYRIDSSYAICPKRGAAGISDGRIKVTEIRFEPLQFITEADAKAEGVGSVEEYRQLWESINGKTKGARWADNPTVWVLKFEYQPAGS